MERRRVVLTKAGWKARWHSFFGRLPRAISYPGSPLLMVVILMACATDQRPQKRGFLPGEAEAHRILIGVAWPFSAKKDLFRNGVELAIDEINSDGGLLGYPIEAEFGDDKGDVTNGKALAQQFGENSEVVAVIGHYDSFISLPASVTYAYYDLLMLSPGSTDPKLTEQGFSGVYRTLPSDALIGTQLAEIARDHDHEKMVIISEKSSYGRQLANAIEFRAEEIGLVIVDRLSYDPGIHEYRLMFNKLGLIEFDGIFIAGFGEDAGVIINQMRDRGMEVPFFGGNGLDTRLLFGEDPRAVDGVLVLSVFHIDNPSPYVQHFRINFKDRFGVEPDAWAAQGYDAVQLLAFAIRLAQSTRPLDVAQALNGMEPWYGVTGQHQFDRKGNVQGKPMVMKIARNGELVFYAHHRP